MYYTELYFKIQVYALIVLLSVVIFILLAASVAKIAIGMTDRFREKLIEQYEEKEQDND